MEETMKTLIEAMGMLSENLSRLQRGEAIAYPDTCFFELLAEKQDSQPDE